MKYNKLDHLIKEGIEVRNGRDVSVGKFYCILNQKTYPTLGGLRNAIRPFGYTIEQYYINFYKTADEGYCEICNKPTSFYDVLKGYNRFCSDGCSNKCPKFRELISKRFIRNPNALKSFRKIRKSQWAALSKTEIKAITDKSLETRKRNDPTGERQREQGRKGRAAQDALYEKFPEKKKAVYQKILNTKIKNGTFKNGMSGPIKKIIIEGIQYECQGYEDILLKYMVEKNISFVHGKHNPIFYPEAFSKRYVPDFYLPYYNLVIDVKSERTYELTPEKLFQKQQATINQGHYFIYFVIHSKTLKSDRLLCELDKEAFQIYLNMLISSQAFKQGRFNDYPFNRSTLQAIGSGSAKKPEDLVCDIVCSYGKS